MCTTLSLAYYKLPIIRKYIAGSSTRISVWINFWILRYLTDTPWAYLDCHGRARKRCSCAMYAPCWHQCTMVKPWRPSNFLLSRSIELRCCMHKVMISVATGKILLAKTNWFFYKKNQLFDRKSIHTCSWRWTVNQVPARWTRRNGWNPVLF